VRRVALVAVAAALALAATAAAAPNPADLEAELVCPTCDTTLDQSNAPVAQRMKQIIRQHIAAGWTEAQIKADLVDQFGPGVLAEPPKSGFDLTAWLIPGAAILLAAIAIALGLRRWRRAGRGGGPPSGEGEPLDSADAERLDADLARYDL